jgi:hypothetical protein
MRAQFIGAVAMTLVAALAGCGDDSFSPTL